MLMKGHAMTQRIKTALAAAVVALALSASGSAASKAEIAVKDGE